MNGAIHCRRCWVSGRVQGVYFRAATQQKAKALGLTGHAINLADGRVEVLACGEATAVASLVVWLGQGPPQARVSDVQSRTEVLDPPVDFTTG
ncbi:MAG: acylphosphatase [Candidatus Competibacterales bacterium]